jgi:amino acid adenylation domain-containing protein/FkbM family methyltransferase
MGCFVNILPIPVDLSGNPDFQTVVRRIRITLLNIHRNQEVSFESISNKIGQNRDTSYNPFFQTGFTFEHPRELYLDNLEVKFIQNHPNGSQLDLFLIFLESNGCITGHFEYSTQLFSASAIKRFSESYLSFLTGVMKNPEKPVALQPILSEKEKHKILCQWNDTNKEYTEPHILHKIFENQVIKTPDATAIKYKNKELTYAEFNSKSNQLTGYLKDSGIKTGTYIGIYMDRSIEMAIAIYGIIKAGCVYVPFDPEFPSKRILFMYEDTRVPIFLTQKHLKEKLPSTQAEIICLDSEWETIANFPDTNIDTAITPDDPAYVIFTSGSTGRPKGVENTHRGICNRLLWMQDEYGLTEFDSVIQKTPYSFDVSVWEFFWPLFTGARLVISPPDTHKDPAELIHIINENKITTIHFVPSMLHLFIENQDASTCTTLKRVICSGEALQNDTRKKFFSCMNAELHNLYGPTEAAVDVTYWDCAKETKADIVPIGYPVANTRIYILDKFLNPVPTGVQGELHIGGVQIASGYLNRPELTEEKFIRDPFSDDPQARMYKTGDITHYLPDGTIEYLGRMDHQVKMSGLRIELGEIESVLCDHPSVGQAAVTLNEFSSNDKRLIAYIVPDKKTAYPSLRLIQIQKDPDSNKKVHDLPNGMSIFCQNKSEADFMYREIFTESQYTKNGILLGPGACVFDVGANIGMFTLFISTMIPEATVYSFEPIPAIYDTLSLNVSLCKSNIKTIPMGLSDKPGREEFTYYRDISIISGRYADAVEEKHIIRSHLLHGQQIGKTEYDDLSKEAIENLLEEKLKTKKYNCELTTISDVIQKEKLNKIDLLKIDAEKSEQDVLNGIADPDWKKINQMVIEIHGGSSRLEKMTTMLESRGYSIKIEKDNALEDTELYLVYAIRTDYAESLSESVNLDNSKIEFNWSQSAFTNDVRTYLSKKLPAHMVPSVFTLLEELPLTSNGKIDRKLLPQPEIKESSKVYVKPRTRLEKILSGLWKNILQVDNISITDNFFEIGGTSLLCVKFVSTLQKELDKKIPIVKVFQYPTVSSLSEYFEKRDMMENSLLESSKSRAELRKKVRYKKYK